MKALRLFRLPALAGVFAALASPAVADSKTPPRGVVLAEKGRTDFSIVIPAEPSATEEFAAHELQRYLGAMSGARFEIGVKPAKHFILVCNRRSAPDNIALPAVVAELPREGYCLSTRGGVVFLIGADDRGTLYAVYDLLERLGCRWLAPGFSFYQGAQEIVPNFPVLNLALNADIVEKPALAWRKLYVEEGHSHTAENLRQMIDWMPKRRFNTLVVPLNYAGAGRVRWDNWRQDLTPELQRRGIAIEVGGHGYENYLNAEMDGGKLFDRHPEWFGMDESGSRSRKPHIVFCTANTEARDYFTTNVIRYLDSHPEIQIFDFWPPDGAKWCACSNCVALGTPSDRQALLLSEVSAVARKTRPDLRFETIAYAACVAPPKKVLMDRHVLLDFCPINQCFEVQINNPTSKNNAAYVAQLRDWIQSFKGDISIYSYYRKYAWHSLPNLIPHYIQNDLLFYRDLGVKGVSSYAEPGDWAAYELNHYVLGALAWNPDANVDAMINDFSAARYGTDAELARKAYKLLEEDVRHFCSLPHTEMKTAEQYQDAIESFQTLSKEVETARANARDKATAEALARLALSLEYARRDIALQKDRVQKAEDARKAGTEDLNAFLRSHSTNGVFVIRPAPK